MGLWNGTPLEIKYPKAGGSITAENRPLAIQPLPYILPQTEASASSPPCPERQQIGRG